MVAAVKGYRLILVMPESMSHRAAPADGRLRRRARAHAQAQGMKGAIARAQELVDADPGQLDAAAVREPGQHRGPPAHHGAGNPRATSPRAVDYLITGVGTGGHITGVRARCSSRSGRALKVFAVEPTLSPVIRGGQPGPAPDPGHRRRLHPANLTREPARRHHPGRRRGRHARSPAARRARRASSSASPPARRWRR